MSSPNMRTNRPAEPGETCTCGRPAVVIYQTEQFGDVGYCGIPDGGAKAERRADARIMAEEEQELLAAAVEVEEGSA